MKRLAEFLVSPSIHLPLPEDRRRARLLAALTLPYTLLMIVLLAILGLGPGYFAKRESLILLGACIVLYGVSYALSRTVRYVWGAALFTVSATVGIFLAVLFENERAAVYYGLSYFAILLFIGSLFCRLRWLLGFYVVTLWLTFLVPQAGQGLWQDVILVAVFNTVAFVLAWLASAVRRQDLEQIEQERARQSHAARMASFGEMAGGVAHEINNPLAIIQGKIAQLRRLSADGSLSPEELGTALETLDQTARRIGRIVHGLRFIARDGDGVPMEEMPLAAIIAETLELCRERFGRGGVRLEVGSLPEVTLRCRGPQIGQVLLNLLGNALDAASPLAERWVRLDGEMGEGLVRIRVTDSGGGIPREVAAKMMQPFFTTKDVGKGTGLGLSISQGIVEAHGGRLVYDDGHSHTRFIVELPVVAIRAPAPQDAAVFTAS